MKEGLGTRLLAVVRASFPVLGYGTADHAADAHNRVHAGVEEFCSILYGGVARRLQKPWTTDTEDQSNWSDEWMLYMAHLRVR